MNVSWDSRSACTLSQADQWALMRDLAETLGGGWTVADDRNGNGSRWKLPPSNEARSDREPTSYRISSRAPRPSPTAQVSAVPPIPLPVPYRRGRVGDLEWV